MTDANNADSSSVAGKPQQSRLPWDLPLYHPLVAFLDAMQAARDLDDFISQNLRRLQNVEEVFTAEAIRRMPAESELMHREAAKLVHRWVHENMEGEAALEGQGADEDAIKEFREERRERLRKGVHELTGDSAYYHPYLAIWNRTQSRPDKSRVLRSSLLMSVVSDFEVLISAVVRAQLALRPEILRTDEQKYSMRDLEAFSMH